MSLRTHNCIWFCQEDRHYLYAWCGHLNCPDSFVIAIVEWKHKWILQDAKQKVTRRYDNSNANGIKKLWPDMKGLEEFFCPPPTLPSPPLKNHISNVNSNKRLYFLHLVLILCICYTCRVSNKKFPLRHHLHYHTFAPHALLHESFARHFCTKVLHDTFAWKFCT